MEFERLLNVVITESGDPKYFAPLGPRKSYVSLPIVCVYIVI